MNLLKRKDGYNPGKITVTEYSYPAGVPAPLSFVFVSDLHSCSSASVLELIKTLSPDAILIGGDAVHSTRSYKEGFDFIRGCVGIAPTFCSVGNHERYLPRGQAEKEYAVSGATVLDNSYTEYKGIRIGGLSSGYTPGVKQGNVKHTPAPETGWLEEFSHTDAFTLLLSHHPEYYDRYVKPYGISLTLSGHAHGGQWRFFGRGVFSPGQGLFPKYTRGHYPPALAVSAGIGNPHRIPRINNPPEILKITLTNNTI